MENDFSNTSGRVTGDHLDLGLFSRQVSVHLESAYNVQVIQ